MGVIWVMERRKSRRDMLLVAGIAAPDPGADRAAEEESEMRERLTAALDRLKSASGKKGAFLYDQPWYVIIGPPGSGKTTALANSGLDFPLSDGGKLQGVGGTRFCEWWLTDNAVLIDTAGRYTTQDSDAAADKAGGERFLGPLKKNRPPDPLNGGGMPPDVVPVTWEVASDEGFGTIEATAGDSRKFFRIAIPCRNIFITFWPVYPKPHLCIFL